ATTSSCSTTGCARSSASPPVDLRQGRGRHAFDTVARSFPRAPSMTSGRPASIPHAAIQRLALGSIAVGVVVLGLKFLAWKLTGSVALYSDALESIINVATAIAAFIAIRVSAMPADDNHPYGHTKAEYFSAVLEGVLIILAALAILREAW